MPEHLKALAYILATATVVFLFSKAPACAVACASRNFDRRRNAWLALTLIAFLSHDIWIYLIGATALLLWLQRVDSNRLALFCFLLFALPPIRHEISALGVGKAFDIDYVRLLALTVLLPAFLTVRKHSDSAPFGRSIPDKLLAGYLILNCLQMFEHRTLTAILREGFFYAFIDVFLPYYVASRALRNLAEFRDVLMSLAVAGLVLGAILFEEFARYWLLYAALERALGAMVVGMDYLGRGGNLRALGTMGHAIVAGYAVAVVLGVFLYLRRVVPSSAAWHLGFLLLSAGLVGTLSRGPWMGAALIIVAYVAFGPAPVLGITKLGVLGLVTVPLLMLTPAGPIIIDYLPFIGRIDEKSVIGRQILAEVSYRLFWENPVLGRYDFVDTPAMQALKGADGIVDLVNTYVVIGLARGLVGLSLFAGFFIAVLLSIYKAMRRLPDRDERYDLGRALIATLLGILLIIGTVSPIFHVPTIYWLVAGLGVGYAAMLAYERAPAIAATRPAVTPRPNVSGAWARPQ
jgi:O-antigen ligase